MSKTTLPFIPDNLTIPQFILDGQHPTKPMGGHGIPWLIEDATGRKVGFEEVGYRLHIYALGALPTVAALTASKPLIWPCKRAQFPLANR